MTTNRNLPGGRRPSDRFYGRLHWALMSVIALVLLYGFFVSRWLILPRPAGFRLVVLVLLCFNVLWWSIADRRIARHVRSPRLALGLRLAVAAVVVALNLPLFQASIWGFIPPMTFTPTWYASAATLWQIALPVALPIVAAIRLMVLGVIALARRFVVHRRPSATAEALAFDPSRRAVLKTAVAYAPIALLAGGTAWGRWQEGTFQVNRHTVPAPWLPDRLRGLTITHISDLHVGRLYRPHMLPHLVEQANALNGDIVVVTGDIVDNSNEMLPPALDALQQLTHRHGLFVTIGNHDEIDNRDEFVRGVAGRFPLLINERRTLDIGGERLTFAGVDYAESPQPTRRHRGDIVNVSQTLKGYHAPSDGPVIALAHHPHTWDCLAPFEVPLTLSGHTHGGQIMLTPPNMRPDIGAGRLLFHYISGFYRTEASTLFVNRGVGNWFPLRINAPAEIVQIQLV